MSCGSCIYRYWAIPSAIDPNKGVFICARHNKTIEGLGEICEYYHEVRTKKSR